MLAMLGVDHLSTEYLSYLGLGVVVAGSLIGYVTDAVMGNRGFGILGNGILAIFGALVGIYVRNAFLGPFYMPEIAMTGVIAGSSATALLLSLGLVKHWVQD